MVLCLIGKKYHCISRAVDMLCLFLGEAYTCRDSLGHQIEVAEFSLHVQSPWRFREGSHILLAWEDVYKSYNKNVPDDWEYGLVGRPDELSNVFDVQAKALASQMEGAVVTNCCLSAVNDVTIYFSNGVVFEQFMPASRKDEQWRLIDYKKDVHIVCYDEDGSVSQE